MTKVCQKKTEKEELLSFVKCPIVLLCTTDAKRYEKKVRKVTGRKQKTKDGLKKQQMEIVRHWVWYVRQ